MRILPPALGDVLGRPVEGAARVILRHERRRTFRWEAILELTLVLLCFVCALPLLILLALVSDGADPDIDVGSRSVGSRWWNYGHDLVITVLAPDGRALAEARHTPSGAAEGRGIVAAILSAADRHQIVVVESIGGAAAEVVETWYGGRPLLAHPEAHDEAEATERLRAAGLTVEDRGDEVLVSRPLEPTSRWLAIVIAVLLGPLVLVLTPFSRSMRAELRQMIWDARGVAPGTHTISVRAVGVVSRTVRAGEEQKRSEMRGVDLLAIAFSPALGYDAEVTRHEATLRLIGADTTIEVDTRGSIEVGRALRDLLVDATLRLRALRPELGLAGVARPTRCPYCSTLYVMEPGARCPSCGAWAGRV